MNENLQNKINDLLKQLSSAEDFKEYYKISREVFKNFIGTWQYVEVLENREAKKDFENFIKSFGAKAKLDKEKEAIEKDKFDVIDKFNSQIMKTWDEKNYAKVGEQLFYVLLGNVLEHIGKADVDLQKFNLEKDLYPNLKPPLSLAFYLFQNLTFGPINKKINNLSKDYLNKYFALFLGLWRTNFEIIRMQKMQEEMEKKKEQESENKK